MKSIIHDFTAIQLDDSIDKTKLIRNDCIRRTMDRNQRRFIRIHPAGIQDSTAQIDPVSYRIIIRNMSERKLILVQRPLKKIRNVILSIQIKKIVHSNRTCRDTPDDQLLNINRRENSSIIFSYHEADRFLRILKCLDGHVDDVIRRRNSISKNGPGPVIDGKNR